MPKIIVTSRYLKSGSKKKLSNYVKYIATREGSVPTVSKRENYVGYLANRPGVVKFHSHGLFNESNVPLNLDKVAKEIANHAGNVWTHVVSLCREDAQKMGYDNLQAWRELVKRQIPNIAKHQKIDLANLKWYAAFHDKETNPHVHIIIYSTNEREGFLTNHGIEKIRSGFANDIYQDELHHLYHQQTDLRNLLKMESAELVQKLASDISSSDFSDAELLRLVAKLHEQLVTAKGKKTYGYLKPEIKRTVDEIFSRLAENEFIQKMYVLWCEMEQQKHDVYSSAKVQFPALADNKEFKSMKNMIVQTAMQIQFPVEEASQNRKKALEHLTFSTEQGNGYTQNLINHKAEYENAVLTNTIFSLFANLSKCISEDYDQKFQSGRISVDKKLRRMMQEKKLALGLKEEYTQTQEQSH